MKLNNKGFTLIESIITFAILALAGGMFIVGFYNVSIIASEGSIIKTETDELYNSVISANVDDTALYSSTMTFTFEDGTSDVVKCADISKDKTVGHSANQFKIRLTKFVSSVLLNDWVENENSDEEEDDDEEMIDATIRFHLRWGMSNSQNDFPTYNMVSLVQNSSGGVAYNQYMNNAIEIKENTGTSYYNQKYILDRLNKVPSREEITNSQIYPQDLGGEIIWYQIQKQTDSTYDVIGFVIPTGAYKTRTIVLDDKGKMLFDMQGSDWNYGSLQSSFAKNDNAQAKAISILDGQSYNSKQIYDNRSNYKINIYMIKK